jgi:hypothetical protein
MSIPLLGKSKRAVAFFLVLLKLFSISLYFGPLQGRAKLSSKSEIPRDRKLISDSLSKNPLVQELLTYAH